MANKIVTKTVNEVDFKINNRSFNAARKKMQQLKKDWEKNTKSGGSKRNSPAENLKKNAAEMRKINKTIRKREEAELKKQTAFGVAQAKKKMRADAALVKRQKVLSNARTKQAIGNTLTGGKTPEAQAQLKSMADYYKQEERAAAKSAAAKARAEAREAARAEKERLKEEKRAERIRDSEHKAKMRKRATILEMDTKMQGLHGPNFRNILSGYNSLVKAFDEGHTSAGLFRAQVNNLNRSIKQGSASAMAQGESFKNIYGQLTGMVGAYGVFNAGKGIMETGQFFQGVQSGLQLTSTSAEEAEEKFKFIRSESNRLGVNLKEAANGFTKISLSAKGVMSNNEVEQLFTGLSEYATAAHIDTGAYQRSILAISQMMSKGKIQAQELTGQLGDALPGGKDIIMKAAGEFFNDPNFDQGKLTKKMEAGALQAGPILKIAARMLAERARENGALDLALNSNMVAMQRMGNAWLDFKKTIFNSGFEEGLTKIFQDIATALNSTAPVAKAIGLIFKGAFDAAHWWIGGAYDYIVLFALRLKKTFPEIAEHTEEIKTAFKFAGAVASILAVAKAFGLVIKAMRWLLFLGPKAGAVLGVEATAAAATGGGILGALGKKFPKVAKVLGKVKPGSPQKMLLTAAIAAGAYAAVSGGDEEVLAEDFDNKALQLGYGMNMAGPNPMTLEQMYPLKPNPTLNNITSTQPTIPLPTQWGLGESQTKDLNLNVNVEGVMDLDSATIHFKQVSSKMIEDATNELNQSMFGPIDQ